MSRVFAALAAVLLCSSAYATGGSGNTSSQWRPQDQSFVTRVESLATRYPGKVVLAKYNQRPAVFINLQGGGAAIKNDILKTLGANTIHCYNDEGHLHTVTGVTPGQNTLPAAMQGKNWDLYTQGYGANRWGQPPSWPSDGQQRPCVMFKLPTSGLPKLNAYLDAITNNFDATLGPTVFEGNPYPPPYFGNPQGAHNCTTWMAALLTRGAPKGLGLTGIQPRHSPWMFCYANAKTNASALRGIIVFNHSSPPQPGATITQSFFNSLNWGLNQ